MELKDKIAFLNKSLKLVFYTLSCTLFISWCVYCRISAILKVHTGII